MATTTGKTAISALRVGQLVEAYDLATGVTGPHRVSAVMTNLDPIVEHLSTEAGLIDTTPNHPFFSADRGWVLAGSLRTGEKLRTEAGGTATVLGFTLVATPSTMWDLTVDGAHTFFVGSGAGVLVHNCGDGPSQLYRGAKPGAEPDFTPSGGVESSEFKTGGGVVQGTHGVSVFDNPGDVASRGFVPHEVDLASIPSELTVIQRGGNQSHHEIVPAPGANLSPAEYVCALGGITCH